MQGRYQLLIGADTKQDVKSYLLDALGDMHEESVGSRLTLKQSRPNCYTGIFMWTCYDSGVFMARSTDD